MALRTEEINSLFTRFETAYRNDGTMEFWSARDLQSILGYNNWQNFLLAIERAQHACMNAGNAIADHFILTPVKSYSKGPLGVLHVI